MSDAYAATLGTVADAYEREVTAQGGKSLSRVATIVASSGAFFNRLRAGCTFNVDNLDRFNAWFRQPANWPGSVVPPDAAAALASMGRPVVHDTLMPRLCGKATAPGHFDRVTALKRGDA